MDVHDGPADKSAIRQLVEDWAKSVRDKDLSGVVRHHDAEILLFDVPPPLQSKGIEAYRKSWELFFAWALEPVVFDIKEMTIVAGRDVAFVAATMQCSGTEANGEDIELDFRLTIGLRKTADQWTIVHEHHSIPAS